MKTIFFLLLLSIHSLSYAVSQCESKRVSLQMLVWMVLKTRLNLANFTFHSHRPWRISVAPYFPE